MLHDAQATRTHRHLTLRGTLRASALFCRSCMRSSASCIFSASSLTASRTCIAAQQQQHQRRTSAALFIWSDCPTACHVHTLPCRIHALPCRIHAPQNRHVQGTREKPHALIIERSLMHSSSRTSILFLFLLMTRMTA